MTAFARPFRLLVLPLALLNLCGAALASDAHTAGHAPADKSPAPAAPGDKGARAARSAAAKPVAAPTAAAAADPMDVLREKLAQKLGAAAASGEARSPKVMRVVAKTGDVAHAASDGGHAPEVKAHGATTGHVVAKLRSEKRAAAGHGADKAHGKSGGHGGAHWGYAGSEGPEAWGALKPEFAACSKGTRQSPIDIRAGVKVDLEPIVFDYRPTAFRVLDNGHTVQANLASGNSIEVMGRRYDLVQFHFHRPSEERVEGRQFDMSLHLVHRDPEGRLAVVGVLLERGSVHPSVQAVWNNLPLEKGEEQGAQVLIDPNHLLPADRRYYTYMGSLTTPPCSEGVLWMVMQQPVPVAPDQVAVFARLYPMNARPVQSVAGRLIKASN